MENKNLVCKICGNSESNKVYSVREMMFGTREVFQYLECNSCGCLQLIDIPSEMNKYYPAQYYSFQSPDVLMKVKSDNPVVRFLRHQRTAYMLEGKNIIGLFCLAANPSQPKLYKYIRLIKRCQGRLQSEILDVGCGKGEMLSELSWYGFRNLTGVDPFIEGDCRFGNVDIHKGDIFSLDGIFDIIMLHHSFEHMDKPFVVLSRLSRLLSDRGRIMLRIPTVSSYAWKEYGVNWVGVDAPRHLFLYSLKALEILTSKAGFIIEDILYDSTEYQFWASEQYKNDIPLNGERSYQLNPQGCLFTKGQIEGFTQKAEELNKEKKGDQICVFLAKSAEGGK